jgi:hypothetical protein
MNFQDAQKRFFKQQLGVSSGAYADLAAAYYKGLVNGDIELPQGPEGAPGAPGFPSEAQWNDLEQRVAALEQAANGD